MTARRQRKKVGIKKKGPVLSCVIKSKAGAFEVSASERKRCVSSGDAVRMCAALASSACVRRVRAAQRVVARVDAAVRRVADV